LVSVQETEKAMAGLLPPWLRHHTLDRAAFHDPQAVQNEISGGCDLLIVDSYELGAAYESACRGWARAICVVDDLANRTHDCDVLIDQTWGRTAAEYQALVPSSCHVLTGTAYALLRSDFARLRFLGCGRDRPLGRIGRILVAMGMGDRDGLTERALAGIAESGIAAEVRVFLGRHSPAVTRVRQRFRDEGRTSWSLYENAQDMAQHIAWADVALGAAGTSSWERCSLGLPSLTLTVQDDRYDNQRDVAAALQRAGVALVLGKGTEVSSSQIATALRALDEDSQRRDAMSRAGTRACDALGAPRVAMHVAPVTDGGGRRLSLRPLTADDSEVVYGWQCAPGVRRHFRNPDPPTRDEHAAWMIGRLEDAKAVTEVVVCDGRPAGLVRLDPAEAGQFEVSVLIAPEFQGMGVGVAALRLIRRLVPFGVFRAFVDPLNKASLAAFRRAGYDPQGEWLVHGGGSG
jgi:UDP-2,4-diacetamido-2,4,6-trideoxy-beta-L-altropyranose hydrolase